MASNRQEFTCFTESYEEYLKYMVGEETQEKAQEIHESDAQELIQCLPELDGKDVLELASGVGRFTGELAKRARHVVSTDFMESFVAENKRTNGRKYSNITFRTLDATKLDYPPNSFDFVIGLWLLQYLSDSEVEEFLYKIVRILRPAGCLFMRDSHYQESSTLTRKSPTCQYRTLAEYLTFYAKCSLDGNKQQKYFLDLNRCFNSRTWITLRNIPTLFSYQFKKLSFPNATKQSVPSFHSYLSSHLYSKECLSLSQTVNEPGFVTPGGLKSTKKIVSSLEIMKRRASLDQPLTVLDVGCGFGGFGLYFLQNHDAYVTFLEQSIYASEVLTLTLRNLKLNKCQVWITDFTSRVPNLIPSVCCYDCVSMIHTMDYLENKEQLLEYAKQSLRQPNGTIVIGTFCLNNEKPSCRQLLDLMDREGLHLISQEKYKQLFLDLQFTCIEIKDFSELYLQCIKECVSKISIVNCKDVSTSTKDEFAAKWTVIGEALTSKEILWTHITALADAAPNDVN